MNKRLIKEFDVKCLTCETEITVNTKAVNEVMENNFICPVCQENLTGNVHGAMEQINKCNVEYHKLQKELENNIISIRSLNL